MNSKRSGLLNGFAALATIHVGQVRNGNAPRAANDDVETTTARMDKTACACRPALQLQVRNAKNARPEYSDHHDHNQTASPGRESARQLRTRAAITRSVKQRLQATTSRHVGILGRHCLRAKLRGRSPGGSPAVRVRSAKGEAKIGF